MTNKNIQPSVLEFHGCLGGKDTFLGMEKPAEKFSAIFQVQPWSGFALLFPFLVLAPSILFFSRTLQKSVKSKFVSTCWTEQISENWSRKRKMELCKNISNLKFRNFFYSEDMKAPKAVKEPV